MKKFLYQPLTPFLIHQRFGENKACISLDGGRVITCDGNNPPTGYRSIYGAEGHTGIDLRASHGQEVYCAQDGIVMSIDTDPKSGLDVRVETVFEGKKYLHIYEHLLGYQPRVGDKVLAGQIIGWANNTGWSSGDHLHFELRDENGIPIDPLPVMENIFAKDMLAITNKLKYIQEQVALLMDRLADYLRKK